MKTLLFCFAAMALCCSVVLGLINVPSDGSDGAFNPTANVEVDLSQAVTGAPGVWGEPWLQPGTGTGVYDADKWAVVFKYSSVNIPSGVTVTFKNHASRAPVVWLVQGNTTIAGTVNLDGQAYVWPEPAGLRAPLVRRDPGVSGAVRPLARARAAAPDWGRAVDQGHLLKPAVVTPHLDT